MTREQCNCFAEVTRTKCKLSTQFFVSILQFPQMYLGLEIRSHSFLLLQHTAEDDEHMKSMRSVEGELGQSEKKLSDIIYEVDGIHRVC